MGREMVVAIGEAGEGLLEAEGIAAQPAHHLRLGMQRCERSGVVGLPIAQPQPQRVDHGVAPLSALLVRGIVAAVLSMAIRFGAGLDPQPTRGTYSGVQVEKQTGAALPGWTERALQMADM